MESIRRVLPTALALLALALAGYQHLALRGLDQELKALTPLVIEQLSTSDPELVARVQRLEARTSLLSQASGTSAAAPAKPSVAPPAAAAAPLESQAASDRRTPPERKAVLRRQHEQVAATMMDRWRSSPSLLATPSGRQQWLGQVSDKVRLRPQQVSELGLLLDEEAEQRSAILDQQGANLRTASAAWADLVRLDHELQRRMDRVLDKDQRLAWQMEHTRALLAPMPAAE